MKHAETHPKSSHDQHLPDWGPYSKTHLGVSHIADTDNGVRLDVVPSPGLFRGKLCIPSALRDSDAWPSFATADLRHYRNVHEIAGRERITATIDYIQHGDQVDVYAVLDNRSPEPVACTLRTFQSAVRGEQAGTGSKAFPRREWLPERLGVMPLCNSGPMSECLLHVVTVKNRAPGDCGGRSPLPESLSASGEGLSCVIRRPKGGIRGFRMSP